MSLWTNIRDTVVHAALPVAGAVLGGPAGGILGALIGGGGDFSTAPGSPAPAMPGSGEMIPTAGAVRGAIGAFAAARNWIISARGIVSTMTGRILGVMRGTKLFRNAQVADLAKRIGIDATAAALGITVVEVAQLIAAHLMHHARRRHHRGITGRDVRTTRRTIHKIRSIEHALAQSGICHHRGGRARTAAGTFVRQG